MTNHTPGPWQAKHVAPYCWVLYGPEQRRIASTDPSFDDGSEAAPEECEANARLVAAAPDLLAALEASEKVLEEMAFRGWPVGADLDRVRAAIAEARGDG